MDADRFVASRRARWQALASRLDTSGAMDAAAWSSLAADWRALCADLAEARHVDLPDDVARWLDDLAARAHDRLYGGRNTVRGRWWAWVRDEVPREVRASWGVVLAAHLLFYGPAIAGALAGFQFPALAEALTSPEMLDQVEQMYATPANDRAASDNIAMFGFYVMNNVGIAFRCFATGVLGGLGSVFFLVYNGLFLGVVHGHLARVGHADNLLEFVSGHGPWELTGIAISGAAGLRLGLAVVRREGRTLSGSLAVHAPSMLRLVAGAAVMIAIAAVIEGLWSASPVPRPVKLGFGVVQIGIIALWLLGGGRRWT